MARAKNLKKNQDQQKRNDDGLTPGQRKERYGKETNEYPENIINGFWEVKFMKSSNLYCCYTTLSKCVLLLLAIYN